MFAANFTFDTIGALSNAKEGHPTSTEVMQFDGLEQRWFTAQGNYSGNRADLTIFQTRNGVFDDPAEVSTVAVGTMVIEFTSCTTATLTYDLPGFGLSGTIPISKLLADEICTQINDGSIPLSKGGNATTSTSRLTQGINYGLIGGWFNTATPGQGFLFDFLLDSQFMFVAAFTFDTISPQDGGNISGAEQRWFTAQGNYSGDRAELTIFQTRNGVFDDPAEVTTTAVGTMVIEFTSCTSATLTYDLPGFGLSGTIPISKLLADEICTQINDGDIVLSR